MKTSIILLALLGGSLRAAEPVPMTLDQAIATGLEKSRSLQVARLSAASSAARAGEAGTALLPSLRLAGNYTRLSPGNFSLNSPALPMPITVASVVENTAMARIGLQQPLFTGFRLSSLAAAAEAQSNASSMELAHSEADLVLNVTTAYWALYQAAKLDTLAAENVRRLVVYSGDVRRMVESGLATRNDQLTIEVQLAGAQLARIDADNDRRVALMTLNNAMGEPLDLPVVPVSDPSASTADTLLALAFGNSDSVLAAIAGTERGDLIAAAWMSEAARAGVTAARSSWWPQIELTANYLTSRPNSRYQPVTPEFYDSWDVGVHLAMDIWNWGRTGYAVEQAEALLRQSELQQVQLRENVLLEVRRAALTARRSGERLDLARLGVGQASENLRITEERFRSGLATSSELLDAQVALTRAETNLATASVEAALAGARLTRAVGRGHS